MINTVFRDFGLSSAIVIHHFSEQLKNNCTHITPRTAYVDSSAASQWVWTSTNRTGVVVVMLYYYLYCLLSIYIALFLPEGGLRTLQCPDMLCSIDVAWQRNAYNQPDKIYHSYLPLAISRPLCLVFLRVQLMPSRSEEYFRVVRNECVYRHTTYESGQFRRNLTVRAIQDGR